MNLKKLLLSLFFISQFGFICFSQSTDRPSADALQQRIISVENSLSPLVLNAGDPLWNLEKQMDKYTIPGLSIAVIHNYKIDWAKGYGNTGNKESQRVSEQTAFQAASMSKFVNAVAWMKLKELEKINLDESIEQYLTSWSLPHPKNGEAKAITINQLLSHTAGLSTHGFGGYKDSDNLPSLIQILEGSSPANSEKVVPIQHPNKEFRYSGGGTTLSQLILMDITNSSYEDFLTSTILSFLSMTNSFYSIELDKYPVDLAFGHSSNGKRLKNDYNSYPESAAAGLWTTPTDLAKLILAIQASLNDKPGKILSQQSSEKLITPTLENSNAALGIFTEEVNGVLYLQHSGSNKGFRGKLFFSAENGNGVVIMVNGPNTEIIEEIIRSVALVYNWEGFEKTVTSPDLAINKEDLNQFTGTYSLAKREVKVSLKKGELYLSEKGKWSSKLTALSNSTFIVDVVKPKASIEFLVDDAGKVTKCKLTQGESTEWIKSK
ncbi:CubicO group peptidase, beta-lactamase class C family [Algoriphagus faecimaris]|uniref:CubicO group peptidase, beta-lactamase class C family n=2 Tax=Algoriphagus faecimaris TaxID=686796 RepID=A0A1G6VNQ5_9BACT|nr:serine hydrolase domain-containing protein [Algoriphagus faecimaris]SDD55171.1 CubicO group peptidase, beta-lactamase class C family [Algoriphagus faecimaris]